MNLELYVDGNSSKQAFILEFLDSCGDNWVACWPSGIQMWKHLFFLFDLSLCSVISRMTSDSSRKFVFHILILVSVLKKLEKLTAVETGVVLVKLLRNPLLHVGGVFLFKAFLLKGPWLSTCLNPGDLSTQAAAEYNEVRGSTYVKLVQFKTVVASVITLPWSNVGREKKCGLMGENMTKRTCCLGISLWGKCDSWGRHTWAA